MEKLKITDIKIQDRIIAYNVSNEEKYRGTVLIKRLNHIQIKRDDEMTGGGNELRGYGTLWRCPRRSNGDIDPDCGHTGFMVKETVTNWRKEIED